MAAIPNTLVPARKDDYLLVMIPNYWGKGPNIDTAKKQLTNAAGSSTVRSAKRWIVYSAHKDSYLDDIDGTIIHPKDHAPLRIAAHDPA